MYHLATDRHTIMFQVLILFHLGAIIQEAQLLMVMLLVEVLLYASLMLAVAETLTVVVLVLLLLEAEDIADKKLLFFK